MMEPTITFRLPADERNWVFEAAREDDRSVSSLIRLALSQHLKERYKRKVRSKLPRRKAANPITKLKGERE